MSQASSTRTTPEEFANGCSTLKTHQMFSINTALEEFKTQQSPVILDLCLRKTRAEKSRDYRDVIIFALFLKCFPYTLKRKAAVFKFLWFKQHFRFQASSFQLLKIGKFTAMIILHFDPQPQFKYELCHMGSWSYILHIIFETLRFRGGLVWTVGLTVEKKLRFQIPLA